MTTDAHRHAYNFLTPSEEKITRAFLEKGYVITDIEDLDRLSALKKRIANTAASHLKVPLSADPDTFLNNVHTQVSVDGLNNLRLAVINDLKESEAWFKESYFLMAKNAISTLIGSEIAMQRSVGLSVQLPDDSSSLLPLHTDVWDGDSAFEVVMWLPLVDCFQTKSMYLVPLNEDRQLQSKIDPNRTPDAESLFKEVQAFTEFLEVPYGKVLLFSQTIMHGNRVNETDETRWTMNCRFKSLMSPYADKKLIETFEPITLKAATRIGMNYTQPKLNG
jgi:sporadic carbohydrate cluster 2OG-Fe(II) oxygenase